MNTKKLCFAILAAVMVLVAGLPAMATAPASEGEGDITEPITIKYSVSMGPSPDIPLVEEVLNEMIQDRFDPNVSIELDLIDWGEYHQALNLRWSAGEVMDIVFTPKWWGLFYSNQAQGNLVPLDDYMGEFLAFENEIAPLLGGTTIDGQIWGIPGNQQVVTSAGVGIRTDLLEKYPLDWSTINTFEDIEPYVLDIIDREPEIDFGMPPTESFRPGYYGYDNITTGASGGVFTNGMFGVLYDDKSLEVENLLKSEAFADYCERMDRWHEMGLVSDFHDDNAYMNFRTKYVMYLHYQQPHGWWDPNYPYFGKSLAPPFIGNFRVGENTTAISATSENPRQAYRLYAFLNSDVDVFNTVVYGIEGTHWNFLDKDAKLIEMGGAEATAATYTGPADWELGNQFISYYRSPAQAEADIWAMELELNTTSPGSELLGFVLDTEPILTEIAQVSAVIGEFAPNLLIGWEEDWEEALATLIDLTDDAGMEVIREEIQKQVDEFKATR